ncbi:putative ribonuclease H-like domain-containing protein [Tanacetum coccineum]
MASTGTTFTSNTSSSGPVLKEILASYANKLSPTSLTNANLRKLEANVLNDADYDIWLSLASVHEFLFPEGVDSVLRDGPWMIRGGSHFLNKWSPSVSLLKEDLSRVPDGDNLVMVVPNLERTRYTKETIRVEYEWEPPRCSTCSIFGHSFDNCPKALKRVVNKMDKGKGGSSGSDDEGFIEVKKKKSSDNNRGKKTSNRSRVKPKTHYRPKAKQSTEGASQKTTSSVGKKNVSTSEEGQRSTSLLEKINIFEKQLLEGKCGLVDNDGKLLEKIDYSGDHGSEDEVEFIDN